MVRAIRNLKEAADPDTTFFCLSNANSVFISTILQVRGWDGIVVDTANPTS